MDESVMSEAERDVMPIFAEKVRAHLGFLEELGFGEPVISSVGGVSVGYALKAEYDNDEAGRRVSVSLQSSEGREHAGVAIWRLPVQSYRRDLINFPLLIWSRLPDSKFKKLQFRNYEGSLEDRLDGFLSVNGKLLQSEAGKILAGEDWEEGLYDF